MEIVTFWVNECDEQRERRNLTDPSRCAKTTVTTDGVLSAS
jgi:hypothetical protein